MTDMTAADVADALVRNLRDWGATVENRVERGGATEGDITVDYTTPFPGDQPIWSSAVVDDAGVRKATVRFGVLDEAAFVTHPTRSEKQIRRLKDTVREAPKPQALLSVNYGDVTRVPRPHGLLGWYPPDGPGMPSDRMVLGEGVPLEAVSVGKFMDWAERVGGRIRREYRGEWA